MRVLFIDATAPKAYSYATLSQEALGGTEATVARVAKELASRPGVQVRVIQHKRSEALEEDGVQWYPFAHPSKFDPTHVVLLRLPGLSTQARQQYPKAALIVWMHDMFQISPDNHQAIIAASKARADFVCVSNWHKHQMTQTMLQFYHSDPNSFQPLRCSVVYNPLDERLNLSGEELAGIVASKDPNKLIYFASPHKGLEETLLIAKCFPEIPELAKCKLFVANPGYFPGCESELFKELVAQGTVVDLGPLPWTQSIEHVKQAGAVLHINSVFPETFGLVHAEANAVCTPFLSGYLGANNEISDHPAQLMDLSSPEEILKRLILWVTKGRPKVRGIATFRIGRTGDAWMEILEALSRK